jgi:aminopeptidase N
MWIHESFTNYSESLFVEYYYGKAGYTYVKE